MGDFEVGMGWMLAGSDEAVDIHEIFPGEDGVEHLLKNSLREHEIREISESVDSGVPVWVYGNDGFGKTTLMAELSYYYILKGDRVNFHSVDMTRDPRSLDSALEMLEYFATLPYDEQPLQIFDSLDYVWEDVGDSAHMKEMRLRLRDLLGGGQLRYVAALHEQEPVNKTIDAEMFKEWGYLRAVAPGWGQTMRMSLLPNYPQEKTRLFFERLGFSHRAITTMLALRTPANHALLKNYLLEPENLAKLLAFSQKMDEVELGGLNEHRMGLVNFLLEMDRKRKADLEKFGF